MILTEYFFESLVLLAQILCCSYKVLFVEASNSRNYVVPPLSESQEENFKNLNKQDYQMYEYFNRTLHRKVAEFGHQVQ